MVISNPEAVLLLPAVCIGKRVELLADAAGVPSEAAARGKWTALIRQSEGHLFVGQEGILSLVRKAFICQSEGHLFVGQKGFPRMLHMYKARQLRAGGRDGVQRGWSLGLVAEAACIYTLLSIKQGSRMWTEKTAPVGQSGSWQGMGRARQVRIFMRGLAFSGPAHGRAGRLPRGPANTAFGSGR
eukprot:359700-Chlamydomonas_euryale.AAC.3